jgi:hypothetical protein
LDNFYTIHFASGNFVKINFYDNPVAKIYSGMLEHLRHVPVPVNLADNPYRCDRESIINELVFTGTVLGIDIDPSRLTDQEYLNTIHKIYEKGYDGSPTWLKLHECIHVIERSNKNNNTNLRHFATIDYRELSGKLEKNFRSDYTQCMTTRLETGKFYGCWAELGKNPYDYWKDNEPNDLARFCELSKPWIKIKWKIMIPLIEDTSEMLLPSEDKFLEFEKWFDQYKNGWLNHWGIEKWSKDEIFGFIPLGEFDDYKKFLELLRSGDIVERIALG